MPWTREKLEAEWIGVPIEALGDRAPAGHVRRSLGRAKSPSTPPRRGARAARILVGDISPARTYHN